MRNIRRLRNSLLRLQTRLFLAVFLLATGGIAVAQSVTGNLSAVSGDLNTADHILLRTKTIYETNFSSDTIQVFTWRGAYLGVFARPAQPTGLVFDDSGNLYVSSDNASGYSILKFAPDGTGSIFADSGLSGPHGLVFDTAGNLYVANAKNNTVVKFTQDGVGTVFADGADGLAKPFDLAFDTAGNLYVSNGYGGPAGNGSVLKFRPDGRGSVFADRGFRRAYGLAFDSAGNLYVSNVDSDTIEKFSPHGIDLGVFANAGLNEPLGIMFDRAGNLYAANRGNDTIEKFSSTGTDLGVFAHTQPKPHFMTMFRPSHLLFEGEALKSAGNVTGLQDSK
jgi:sugar lactone lactonase YvrE